MKTKQKKRAKNTRPVLAVMSKEDTDKLAAVQRIISDATIHLHVLVDGSRHLAKEIQVKYALPELYEIELSTGNVFAKETSNGG